MRVLGLDPGYAKVGYGTIDHVSNRFVPLCFGVISTPAKTPFELRLMEIDSRMNELIDKYRPDAAAIEKLFFTSNHKTAIDVAQARGVILLCAAKRGIPVFEYTPLQVKQSVVGYGKAEKQQVMEMTRIILSLRELPKPDDAADALAVAICHAHSAGSLLGGLQNAIMKELPG
ncbi:MAG: crossover junction endodeoxyribonuclease RuvC [Oscillospiraceae bacterium]|nr:crossover junction endodeoxyribonuclease RuvC [Oscillospiraceae bacterium]